PRRYLSSFPTRRSSDLTMIIQGLIRLFFGTDTYSFFTTETKQLIRIPVPLEGVTRTINFTQPQVLMIVVTVVAVAVLHYFLTRTPCGQALRDVAGHGH